MTTASVNGIEIFYEVHGSGDPVMLITGLGGVGRGWGPQIPLFAEDHLTIVPDHRGTGQSSKPDDGYTIEQHASDMAETLRRLGCGPAHIVGSSTGGAIALAMALDHADVVRSISVASSWARADDYFRHQFAVRKDILLRSGEEAYVEATALFLFSPPYFRDHYDEVRRWCTTAASGPSRPDLMAKRIDMIVAFDEKDRLADIHTPTLVLVGGADACTPPHFSRELASLVPGAELAVLDGGHLIYKEQPEAFHARVREFLLRH